MSIAPYQVCIVAINTKDEEIMNYANLLHDELIQNGVEVLLDDRDERPGVKFNDMDLIGIPIRITVGKKLAEGKVELKLRTESEAVDVETSEVINKVKDIVKKELN